MSATESKRTVLIVGAGSPIARAVANAFAAEGHSILLAGRRIDDLRRTASDLALRSGARCDALELDTLELLGDPASSQDFLARCERAAESNLQGIVWCVGLMPDEEAMRRDSTLFARMVETNYTSAVALLESAAMTFVARDEGGFIAGVTSVAGDRGRASNALYGSSKAALSTHLAGLRARLVKHDVVVVDIKPGFVDTAMTYGKPGTFLVARPERIARDLVTGVRRNRAVTYSPGFWRPIMLIIRMLPDVVFKRLSL